MYRLEGYLAPGISTVTIIKLNDEHGSTEQYFSSCTSWSISGLDIKLVAHDQYFFISENE